MPSTYSIFKGSRTLCCGTIEIGFLNQNLTEKFISLNFLSFLRCKLEYTDNFWNEIVIVFKNFITAASNWSNFWIQLIKFWLNVVENEGKKMSLMLDNYFFMTCNFGVWRKMFHFWRFRFCNILDFIDFFNYFFLRLWWCFSVILNLVIE